MARSHRRPFAAMAMVIVVPVLAGRAGDARDPGELARNSDGSAPSALGLPAAPAFIGLGHLPGDVMGSQAMSVTPDGRVVIGSAVTAQGIQAFRWTPELGMIGLGDLPGGETKSVATAVSISGNVVVGWSASANGPQEAFRWQEGFGIEGLGDLSGGTFNSTAADVSANGATIVGWGSVANGVEAFRWTLGTGMKGLGDLPGGIFASRAMGVSGDGSVIVGWGNSGIGVNEAFRWTELDGMVGLGFVPDSILDGSMAFDVSFDGRTIVGNAWAELGVQAMRHTDEDGMTALGDLPGGAQPFSFAFGVSADGRTIVGRGELDGGESRAFIWRSGDGMRSLQEVLEVDFGLKDMAGWTLIEARAVSIFGTTVVGWGTHNGIEEAWMALLPDPCPPDLDHDGMVGMLDMLALLTVFGPCSNCMSCPADFNGDCEVNTADLLILLGAWGPCS